MGRALSLSLLLLLLSEYFAGFGELVIFVRKLESRWGIAEIGASKWRLVDLFFFFFLFNLFFLVMTELEIGLLGLETFGKWKDHGVWGIGFAFFDGFKAELALLRFFC